MDTKLEYTIRQIVREELSTLCTCNTRYEPTWTAAQVAEFLGLKPKTIHNRISAGVFPKPRKNGRLNAFIPSEIAAYRAQSLGLNEE